MKQLLELFAGILVAIFTVIFMFISLLCDCLPAYKYSQRLIEAIDEDNFERFEELLEEGGDLDSRPHFLSLDRVNMPPLHYSCYQGKLEYVVALVEAGANVDKVEINSAYETPLIAALASYEKTRIEVAKYLVEAGADVNIAVNNYSALDYVFTNNSINYNEEDETQEFEFAIYLIEMGADYKNVRLGNLIFDAAKQNNLLMVDYLLNEKNVNSIKF